MQSQFIHRVFENVTILFVVSSYLKSSYFVFLLELKSVQNLTERLNYRSDETSETESHKEDIKGSFVL